MGKCGRCDDGLMVEAPLQQTHIEIEIEKEIESEMRLGNNEEFWIRSTQTAEKMSKENG